MTNCCRRHAGSPRQSSATIKRLCAHCWRRTTESMKRRPMRASGSKRHLRRRGCAAPAVTISPPTARPFWSGDAHRSAEISYAADVNEAHEYCGSDEWRATIREIILPWALAETDLGDDVLEVGPGYGATTDVLGARQARLTSVEIDDKLAALLHE